MPSSPVPLVDPMLDALEAPVPVLESTHNVFHDLMSCVVEQQIHYRSSKGLFQKRLDSAGITDLSPGNFAHFTTSLSQIKLSQRKHDTVAHVLAYFQTNQIKWQSLSDQEVRDKLSTIKGIGDWTIDMILLYTLERPDIFPVGDYHLKKIMCELYNLHEGAGLKVSMTTIAEAWRPHRSYAVRKLLAWRDWQKQTVR